MKEFAGDIIILYMCMKYHNHKMYAFWHMECNRQNFLSLWAIFFLLPPPPPPIPQMDPENQNFEKMKKKLENTIILQMFTINYSHIIYGFSDTECNRQNFLSFWTIFCTFNPLTTWKVKILKNWKKLLEISSFHTSVPKIVIIC